MIPIHIVGIGMSPEDLTPRAWEIIQEAQVLVGGRRLLGYFPEHPAQKIPLGKDPAETLRQLPALAETLRVVVLASGDPNFYGVGPLAVQILGAEQVLLHPNITAVQAACARLQVSWQDARVVSLHGRSWEPLAAALSGSDFLLIYTDPQHAPAEIARFLLARGYEQARLCVLEDLGQETERLTRLPLQEAQDREFSPLNLVALWPGESAIAALPLHLGLSEEALEHEAGLITKLEVRAVVLAKLALQPGLVLWDLGAGCGSVSLEAGLLLPGGRVVAVEQNPQRAAQIAANREKFKAPHLEVVCGRAPECLAGLPTPQRVFVGGGGRHIKVILQEVMTRLAPGGRVVLAATLLETLETARAVLSQAGWQVEITHLQVSRSRPLAGDVYMQALNPVWIVSSEQWIVNSNK